MTFIFFKQQDINKNIDYKTSLPLFFLAQREAFQCCKNHHDSNCLFTEKKGFFPYFTHLFGITFQSFIEFYKVLFRLPRTSTNDLWNICMQTIHKIYWKVPAETSMKIITSAFAANSSISNQHHSTCFVQQDYVIYTGIIYILYLIDCSASQCKMTHEKKMNLISYMYMYFLF